ncbi:MAG: MinD/ParA family protein, partial [Lachnospiraceae bacterium]|nr:MinD/ParA family protein [Lachnospiraceae bacterium]
KALKHNPRYSGDSSKIKVISNKVSDSKEGELLYKKLNAVVQRYLHLDMTYLGSIPEDHELSKAVMQQNPVCLSNMNAKSARAFDDIAKTLMDIPHEKPRGMAGFFASMIRGRG